MIYEVIYCSDQRIKLSKFQVLRLFVKSKTFNTNHKITGCLAYHNNQFVQVIEGERHNIESLWTKIIEDNRHENITVVRKNYIKERNFNSWNMYIKNDKDKFSSHIAELAVRFYSYFIPLRIPYKV